jgi:hypothetical protein
LSKTNNNNENLNNILWNIKIDNFIEKENFKNLFWCIAVVVGITEITKIFLPVFEPRIIVVFWSFFVSAARLFLVNNIDRENAKEKVLIAFFNLIPIALGAIGSYDMIVKLILKTFHN